MQAYRPVPHFLTPMAEREFSRLFTVEEANDLLKVLRPLVHELLATRDHLVKRNPSLQSTLRKLDGNGGNRGSSEIVRLFDHLHKQVDQIQGYGALVKDVNSGLLDFPAEREGRVVFLCWRHDEPVIQYWHELNAGFPGRQPL